MDGTKRDTSKGRAVWKTYNLLPKPLTVDECAKRCDEKSTCSAFEFGKDISKEGYCHLGSVSNSKFTAKPGVDLYVNKVYIYKW
jgi:hypothetical protein